MRATVISSQTLSTILLLVYSLWAFRTFAAKNHVGRIINSAFEDTFSGSTLNTGNWIVSNYSAADYAGGGTTVTFSPNNLNTKYGMLQMVMQQPTATTSTGAEIQSVRTFGYGTYEFKMRMGTTSPTPTGSGNGASGSISAGFSWINDSQTEIDVEQAGAIPYRVDFTSWDDLCCSTERDVNERANLSEGFHDYRYVWTQGELKFYFDGILQATMTANVPSTPAYIFLNFYGINMPVWGSPATVGVTRYQYVSYVSYTPL